ncbi:MAG: esterase-like activity of phytase family protein [Thiotrichaceae bacterium]|nr:esterase-like activity of phytase family protein [Thiotrichaceae bacterium]
MIRKLVLLIIGLVFVCFIYYFMIRSTVITLDIKPKGLHHHQSVQILGTVQLKNQSIDGVKIGKLSGLAWDEDHQRLLAISDTGYLFHFSIEIKANTLSAIIPIAVYPLHDKHGKSLVLAGSEFSDAEGLVLTNADNGIANDTLLWVSFERNMRVVNYNSKGQWLAKSKLPEKLSRGSNYSGYNSGLEAIVIHPKYGLLIAPEYRLKNGANSKHVIYTAGHQKPQTWQFWSSPYQDSGIVAMELMPSGELLVLERSWVFPFTRVVISLRTINLEDHHPYLPIKLDERLVLDSQQGWHIDNYEGLAHISSNQFIMVSDDNGNFLQNTLFTLLSIAPSGMAIK